MIVNVQSWLKVIELKARRYLDHAYRLLTGLPMIRYSQISDKLWLGGMYSPLGLKTLARRGVTAVVSMREHALAAEKDFPHIEFLHLPTRDRSAPTLTDLQRGVAFITKHIDQGDVVYVHCMYGEGRGPTMLAAYLISQGMTVDDALSMIREVRSFIRPTAPQLHRLAEFAAQL